MKVKIGNKIIDSNNEPIMIIFKNDQEKELVINHLSCMESKEGERKYLMYPDDKDYSTDEMKEFMKTNKNK
jgi:hypothetical protein